MSNPSHAVSITYENLSWKWNRMQWHINLQGLFNDKAIFAKEQQQNNLAHSWGNKGVYTFPKVNTIPWVEFELTHFEVKVEQFSL